MHFMLLRGLWGHPSLQPGLHHQGSHCHVITGQGEDEGNNKRRQWYPWRPSEAPPGLRTSLSARVLEDCNSYMSGATWGPALSFWVFKGEEELIWDQVQARESKQSQWGAHTPVSQLSSALSRVGQGTAEATGKMIPGQVQSRWCLVVFKLQHCDALVSYFVLFDFYLLMCLK